jgi:hypothetical protein
MRMGFVSEKVPPTVHGRRVCQPAELDLPDLKV